MTEVITIDSKHKEFLGSYFISCNKNDQMYFRPIIFKKDRITIRGRKRLSTKWEVLYTYKLTKSIRTKRTFSGYFGKLRRQR